MRMTRRTFLTAGVAATTLAAAPRAFAQWQPSLRYPDPAVQIVDQSFARYRLGATKVERLATGFRWSEGPAWFGDGRYLLCHFKKAGLEHPRTCAELLKHGKVLKAQGSPVGIAVSHSNDANPTSASVLWCYGGKVMGADGKTPAINSEQTAQVIEWYKELYRDAMEPEVLPQQSQWRGPVPTPRPRS